MADTGAVILTTGVRVKTGVTLGVGAAVLFCSCADAEPDSPRSEPTPPEGVFGQAPAALGGIPSVITLEAEAPIDRSEAPEFLMDQLGLQFSPLRLLVRVGQPVRFQNSESIAHNVHVRSMSGDSTVFNEDTMLGQSASFVFDEEGGYDVKCDVHPGMTAFIFVTSAPYAVFAEQDGAFHASGVPAGEYTLNVWSVDAAAHSEQTIVTAEGEGTEVTLR